MRREERRGGTYGDDLVRREFFGRCERHGFAQHRGAPFGVHSLAPEVLKLLILRRHAPIRAAGTIPGLLSAARVGGGDEEGVFGVERATVDRSIGGLELVPESSERGEVRVTLGRELVSDSRSWGERRNTPGTRRPAERERGGPSPARAVPSSSTCTDPTARRRTSWTRFVLRRAGDRQDRNRRRKGTRTLEPQVGVAHHDPRQANCTLLRLRCAILELLAQASRRLLGHRTIKRDVVAKSEDVRKVERLRRTAPSCTSISSTVSFSATTRAHR